MADISPISLPPEAWKSKKTRRFATRHDTIRQLLVIEHPWHPSHEGGFGSWEMKLAPPAGARPQEPLFVSFYQSDNY